MMLSTKDLPITNANQDPSRRKLQHLWARSYKITKFRGPNTVELELLADMMIHDTVNISRVKKYTAGRAQEKPPPPPVRTVRDQDGTIHCSYVIEAITPLKIAPGVQGGYKYQIKWKGYDDAEMTWAPAANLSKAKEMLNDYKKQHGLGEMKVKQKRRD
jgi:hypothetical protein